MAKTNAENARIKREYFIYLREAKRRSEASVDQVAAALNRFEESNGHKNFRNFHKQQAIAFKNKLAMANNAKTGKPLSHATRNSILAALTAFFIWLADRPGYKSKLHYSDADYFNLSEKDVRIATAQRDKPVPTLEQLHHLLASMPSQTDIELRNRAIVAFLMLTGCRDGALVSLKLKHIDLAAGKVVLDAREVNTKASKSFSTWFLPVGGEALAVLTEWITYLRSERLYGDDDAAFPSTEMGLGQEGGFQPVGLLRDCWKTAEPVRRILRKAYAAAGLPYFPPHRIRDTLAQLGERVCRSPEEFKAWSQNIGHTKVLTTFMNYGQVPSVRQAELIREMGARHEQSANDDDLMNDPDVADLLNRIAMKARR